MAKMLSLSVVIPTYYRNNLLELILESLYFQKKYISEVIIVDNSLDQHAKKTVYQYSDLLLKYYHIANGGSSKARNLGIKRASGDIVAFLDDDCIPQKSWAHAIIKQFQKEKRKVILMGRNLNGYSHNPISAVEYFETELTYRSNYYRNKKEIRTLALDSKNMAIQKDMILKDRLFFDEFLSYYTSFEDIDYGIRARHNGYIILFSAKMKAYHHGRNRLKHFIIREWKKAKGLKLFIKKWNINSKDMQSYHIMSLFFANLISISQTQKKLFREMTEKKTVLFKINFYLVLYISKIIHFLGSFSK